MSFTPENLRFILGLKVKSVRQRRGRSLTDVAKESGLSVSYLSEIENGRKYPTPEKLLRLAKTLGVGYEELVSPHLGGELDALEALFHSDFLQEFPFDLFGLTAGDLLGLVSDDPVKAAAFVQTFLEIGQSYDMQVEQFLFAALRSYQRLHSNYFPELEEAAADFRRARGWPVGEPLEEHLREYLETEHGYLIADEGLARVPELANLRSVYLEGDPPRLLLNPTLASSQRAFIYGREVGFRELDVEERATTSTWVRVESFDQVLGNFKASYFSGALLVDGDAFARALERFWRRETWDPDAYVQLMDDFNATPEMFAYRMTEILPGRLGMDKLYFMRFHHTVGTDDYEMNKILNMTGMSVPRGVGLTEHYCRRWVTTRALQELDERLASGGEDAGPQSARGDDVDGGGDDWPRARRPGTRRASDEHLVVRGERVRFVREDAEFLVITAAQPIRRKDTSSSITLGFLIDDGFERQVRFLDDPALGGGRVGLTCERCPISDDECDLRRVPPRVLERARKQERQVEALRRLREEAPGAASV